ncbi:MAG: phytoene/squalene synthase family protein [Hyphomicrobiaceae bacterium]
MDEIVALSRERIERGSKSFALAARLFQPSMRDDAYQLYAWCRHCDDVIDGQELGHGAVRSLDDRGAMLAALGQLEQATRAALAGNADDPVFVALARVVAAHDIPHRHPFELLEGFRMDAEGRHYQTIEDTLSYCYHVAGVVGVMMARIMGARDLATLRRAQDLGLAFQLTNIARDVVADAEAGRVYLPQQWLDEAGLKRSDILDPGRRTQLAAVVHRLLHVAEPYYKSSGRGLAELPWRAAWAVAAAGTVYREIGEVVKNRGPAAWDRRAVVRRRRKIGAVVTGLAMALASRLPAASRADSPRDPTLWTKPELTENAPDARQRAASG